MPRACRSVARAHWKAGGTQRTASRRAPSLGPGPALHSQGPAASDSGVSVLTTRWEPQEGRHSSLFHHIAPKEDNPKLNGKNK